MTFRRIVFGLGAEPREPILRAAKDIAAATDAALLGVFVEDRDLLQLAGFPGAREVGLAGAARRFIDPSSMARALRASAQAAEQDLRRSVADGSTAWSFEVVRGSAFSAVLDVTREGDLAIVSLSAGAVVAPPRGTAAALRGLRGTRQPVLLVHTRQWPRPPLVAVARAGTAPDRTVATLGVLARHYGRALRIVVVGDGASARTWEERLTPHDVSVQVQTLPGGSDKALSETLMRERPGLVALCGDEVVATLGSAAIDRIACPVMLLPDGRD